jgi:AraC-like DNA-binding protein
LGKIAVDTDRLVKYAPGPGANAAQVVARGDGWLVDEVVCTYGPSDRPFEEQHDNVAVAIVLAGSFQYRTSTGHALMTPGSLLLGNPGQPFICSHEHGRGDRCLSFRFAPGMFENLAAAAGARRRPDFTQPRIPPLKALSPLLARACAGIAEPIGVSWEELGVEIASEAMRLSRGISNRPTEGPPGAAARVTRTIRLIERHPETALTLEVLSREARLSPYHFLRTFQMLTGVTPHQYLLRVRLRHAALRLASHSSRILDVALDCGFGDLSSFNRAFRAEYGVNPRRYRGDGRIGRPAEPEPKPF